MSEKTSKGRASHCAVKRLPFPQAVQCPSCGKEEELWSDEEYVDCDACGGRVANPGPRQD